MQFEHGWNVDGWCGVSGLKKYLVNITKISNLGCGLAFCFQGAYILHLVWATKSHVWYCQGLFVVCLEKAKEILDAIHEIWRWLPLPKCCNLEKDTYGWMQNAHTKWEWYIYHSILCPLTTLLYVYIHTHTHMKVYTAKTHTRILRWAHQKWFWLQLYKNNRHAYTRVLIYPYTHILVYSHCDDAVMITYPHSFLRHAHKVRT